MENHFWQCSNTIDNILWTALSGENDLSLTPRMLESSMLKHIIDQHSELNLTIFKENPYLLYSIAKMSLVEVDEKLDIAHFILQIPLIYSSETLDLFSTAQVGTFVKINTCAYFSLPENLYKKDNKFYDITLDKCIKNNNLYICSSDKISNKTSCIQNDNIICSIRKTMCKNYYEFDMSQVGILLRNNKDQDTFTVDNNGWTTNIILGPSKTAYIAWNNTNAIQVGETKVISPQMEFTPLTIANFSFDIPIAEYVDGEKISKVFSSICEKYNTTLDNLVNPVFDEHQNRPKIGDTLIWCSVLTVLTIVLGAWITYIQFTLFVLRLKLNIIQGGKPPELKYISGAQRSYSF